MLSTSFDASGFSFSFHQSSRTCRTLFSSFQLLLAGTQRLSLGAVSTVAHGPSLVCLLARCMCWLYFDCEHTVVKMFSNKSLFWRLIDRTEQLMKYIWSVLEVWPTCTSEDQEWRARDERPQYRTSMWQPHQQLVSAVCGCSR